MLADRDYMREPDGDRWAWLASPTKLLLVVNAAVFLLQLIDRNYLHSPLERYLALSPDGLAKGWVWQLFAFQVLHFSLMHFLFNALGLWFLGRAVENTVGRARFWEVYFLAGTAGGLLQSGLGLALPQHFGGVTMGASAGLMGLLAIFCLVFRNAQLLIFFVIPVRAYYVLVGSLVLAAIFLLFPSENGGVAHAAHLGGLLAGMGYYQWILRPERRLFDWRSFSDFLPRRPRRVRNISVGRMMASRRAKPVVAVELPPEEFISKEVDPILDKISQHGIQSLTEREKKILEAARSKMAKR
jgi:membrane associated rhomboid family serine protease